LHKYIFTEEHDRRIQKEACSLE